MTECIFLKVCFLKVLGLALRNRDTYLSSQKKKGCELFCHSYRERCPLSVVRRPGCQQRVGVKRQTLRFGERNAGELPCTLSLSLCLCVIKTRTRRPNVTRDTLMKPAQR